MREAAFDRLADIEALHARGAGVFITVNETDQKGRRRSSIQKVRAVWCDLDDKDRAPGVEVDLQQLALPPTIVTRSARGSARARAASAGV